MNDLVETKQTEERVILVAVRQSDDDNTDRSLDELEELASTAGAVTVTRINTEQGSHSSGNICR